MKDEIMSRHGDLRMMQRTGEMDMSATEMWDGGIPCNVSGHGYEEARVSPEHGAVLLMEDDKIVTVLNSEPLDLRISNENFEEYLDRSIE